MGLKVSDYSFVKKKKKSQSKKKKNLPHLIYEVKGDPMLFHDLSMLILFKLDSYKHLCLLVTKEGDLMPEYFCVT